MTHQPKNNSNREKRNMTKHVKSTISIEMEAGIDLAIFTVCPHLPSADDVILLHTALGCQQALEVTQSLQETDTTFPWWFPREDLEEKQSRN